MKRKRTTPASGSSNGTTPDHVFDPEGDLLLRATQEGSKYTKKFLVNRACLCVVSPVFRAMLGQDSPFIEGSAADIDSSTPVVDVEEHHVDSLFTLFAIFHHKHLLVKEEMTSEELYDIALLCDKYDCSESLRPWSAVWIKPHLSEIESENEGVENCLFIAWTLQSKELFEITTKLLICNSQLTTEGKLYVNEGDFTVEEGPTAVIDEIIKIRNYHIRAIQKTVLHKINLIRGRNDGSCENCTMMASSQDPYLGAHESFLLDAFPDVEDQSNEYILRPQSIESIRFKVQCAADNDSIHPLYGPGSRDIKLEYLLTFMGDRLREIEGIEMPKR